MTSVERDQRPDADGGGQGRGERPHPVKGAHIISERIEVGVPVQDAFDLWNRYDDWHQMFKKESASTKDRRGRGGRSEAPAEVKVSAKIGPSRREWVTETTEVDAPNRIAWRAKGGLQAHGVTTFHQLDDHLTRIMAEIEYKPSGVLETIGNTLRMQRRRVRRDLRLFKNYAELHAGDDGGDDR